MSFSTVKHPPPIESLSPDLQYHLWERNKRASKTRWIWTVMLAAPAVAFIAIEPINSVVTGVYRAADFFNLVSDDRVVIDVSELGLEPEQIENAATIIQVGQELGASENDILIALMAASQESNLYNVDHGDDWWFQQNGWGEVSDSRGLFQQRDSWGSEQCRMQPDCAAKLFYEALFGVPNHESMSLNDAAQAVQNSAFPNEYAKWEDQARSLWAASQPDKPEAIEVVDPSSKNDFQQGDRFGKWEVSRGMTSDHIGVDLWTPDEPTAGQPVYALVAGVVKCSENALTGGVATLEAQDYSIVFEHTDPSACRSGSVQTGQQIAVVADESKMGTLSTGPHLHIHKLSKGVASLPTGVEVRSGIKE